MFEKSANFRSKLALAVTIRVSDEEPFEASVFLRPDERLIDLLNDERAFIPIVGPTGRAMIIAKTNIISVIERDAGNSENESKEEQNQSSEQQEEDHSAPRKTRRPVPFDAYMILRVSKDADLDTIKKAYKERLKAVHPDALEALDLDPDLKHAAILSTQKVNRAYQEIIANFKSSEKTQNTDAA